MDINLNNKLIIIARMKGQSELKVCDDCTFCKPGEKGWGVFDLLTGERYDLFRDVEEYLAIEEFPSLKKFTNKQHWNEKEIQLLHDYLQTHTFKKEFQKTYNKCKEGVDELVAILDKCDNTYDL